MGEDVSGEAEHFNKGTRWKPSQKWGSKKHSVSLEKHIAAKNVFIFPHSRFFQSFYLKWQRWCFSHPIRLMQVLELRPSCVGIHYQDWSVHFLSFMSEVESIISPALQPRGKQRCRETGNFLKVTRWVSWKETLEQLAAPLQRSLHGPVRVRGHRVATNTLCIHAVSFSWELSMPWDII